MSSPLEVQNKTTQFSEVSENRFGSVVVPNKEIHLLDLPVEIIQMIASRLPISAAACLTLCSRALKETLGTQYLTALCGYRNEDRRDFIFLMLEKWPEYFCCQYCYLLHPISDVTRPGKLSSLEWSHPTGKIPNKIYVAPSRFYYHSNWVEFAPGYDFNFHHVQLALLSHQYGASHGIPLERLNHIAYEIPSYSHIENLTTVDARIYAGELIMRTQNFLTITAAEVHEADMKFSEYKREERQQSFPWVELPIWWVKRIYHNYQRLEWLQSDLESFSFLDRDCDTVNIQQVRNYPQGTKNFGFFNSPNCNATLHVRVETNSKTSDISLIFTIWRNFGDNGKSLEYEDDPWGRKHWATNKQHIVKHAHLDFEGQDGQSLEALTKQNRDLMAELHLLKGARTIYQKYPRMKSSPNRPSTYIIHNGSCRQFEGPVASN